MSRHSIHSQSASETEEKLTIRNGALLPPVSTGDRLVQFKNTYPFDSALEILSTAYIDNATYKENIDSLDDNCVMIALIKRYVSDGPTAHFYIDSGQFLATRYEIDENNISNCAANIGTFIERNLSDFPSASMFISCTNCDLIMRRPTIIDVDA